ncbi:MAG TPA: TonB-dependent receptor [Caulobacteraceae bacterium]|nr:TonB-dependent receptor [Caulobacteraceae bacterium]
MNFKRLVWATTALTGGLLLATQASAQSSGTQAQESTEVEEVVVTASRGLPTIDGAIAAEQAPKSRSTVTQEFIATQTPGQSILQTINLVPGVNYTNNDAYGSSGGNLRMRGFDGNRVSLTFDGIPLNDTGNYAIYGNQQMDPELIERATVNLGTTDVDSPTASATGGTVNYLTLRPSQDFGVMLQGSAGENNYGRIFGLVNTGALAGVEDLSAWFSASYTGYDKFKGPGNLQKKQFNGRVFYDLGGGDFVSLAAHWNENRNDFYRNPTLAQWKADPDLENFSTCVRDTTPDAAGRTDDDSGSSSNPNDPASCTSYYALRINPSDTGNVRAQFRKSLSDSLIFTFDPYYQYTLANGGGTTSVEETDSRLRGLSGLAGVDLNGDGDIVDKVRLYTPNTTNTNRVGLTSSLIWDVNDNHRLRFAYTWDHGKHRQTGEYAFLSPDGNPINVFGGKPGVGGGAVLTADGAYLQGRDRASVAELNQYSVEYRGQFMEERMTLALGLRAPFFKRELNQYCWSRDGSSSVWCTDGAGTPVANVTGNVTFPGASGQYIAPYSREVEFDDVLPNAGLTYRLSDNHVVYVSYAEGLSAPRTDNLYTIGRADDPDGAGPLQGEILNLDVEAEKTESFDLGYRYQGENLIASTAIWTTDYSNRIVSSYDDEIGGFVDRNVGAVEMWGVDGQLGWQVTEAFSLYGSASYIDSELQENIALQAYDPDGSAGPLAPVPGVLPTKGKELVETPEWQFAARAYYDTEWFSLGAQAKYVGERWSTDVNDEQTDSYVTVDAEARFKLDNLGYEGSYVQLNVINLFDEEYLGSISSRENAVAYAPYAGYPGQLKSASAPSYSVGAPRTVTLTLRARF